MKKIATVNTNLPRTLVGVEVQNVTVHGRETYSSPVTVNIDDLNFDSLTVDQLLVKLQSFKNDYSNVYSNMRFRFKNDCGCHHNCNCNPGVYLVGDRLETDDEVKARVVKERKTAELESKREREEFERLSKKFGK